MIKPARTQDVGRRLVPPPKRYKIGELAAYTGLTRQTLHNYTRWGLIREVGWTGGGHRLYDERVFDRLVRIMELRDTRSIEQIRSILDEDVSPRVAAG